MHAILEKFLNQVRAQTFIAKYEAAEAAATDGEGTVSQTLVDAAMADANVSTTASPRAEDPTFEPNRAMRRHAAKNPEPGKKKVRLGGYGRMVQSYFEQKRGLERDEKRLAKAQRAADVTNQYLPQHAA